MKNLKYLGTLVIAAVLLLAACGNPANSPADNSLTNGTIEAPTGEEPLDEEPLEEAPPLDEEMPPLDEEPPADDELGEDDADMPTDDEEMPADDEEMPADDEEMPAGEEMEVVMVDNTYMPAEITIPAGTTVTWVNEDGWDHTVTAGTRDAATDMFDELVAAGESFSFTFDEPGTYDYFCSLHPGMDGVVIVE